jgi:hypothetical protein
MIFRYDFGKKIDTTQFAKQAKHYIYAETENNWEFNFPDYRLHIKTSNRVKKFILVSTNLVDLIKDDNGIVIDVKTIYVLNDSRFNTFKVFDKFYVTKTALMQPEGAMGTDDIDECIQSIADFLKILSKINNLKAFL